jgi:hypothetical protein
MLRDGYIISSLGFLNVTTDSIWYFSCLKLGRGELQDVFVLSEERTRDAHFTAGIPVDRNHDGDGSAQLAHNAFSFLLYHCHLINMISS